MGEPHLPPLGKREIERFHGQQQLIQRYTLWRQTLEGAKRASKEFPERDIFVKIPHDEDFYMRIVDFLRIVDSAVVESEMFLRLEYIKNERGKEVAQKDEIGTKLSGDLIDRLNTESIPDDPDLIIGPRPMPEWLGIIVPSDMTDKLRRIKMLTLWTELLDKKFVAARVRQEFLINAIIEEEKGRRRSKAIHIRYNEKTFNLLYACIFTIISEIQDENPALLPQIFQEIQKIKDDIMEINVSDLHNVIPQNYIIELPRTVDLEI